MKTSQERASQQSQTLAPTRFTAPPFAPLTHQQCIVLGVQVSLSHNRPPAPHPRLPSLHLSLPPPVSVPLTLCLSLTFSPLPCRPYLSSPLPSPHTHLGCCE